MSLSSILCEREPESLHQGAPEKGPTYYKPPVLLQTKTKKLSK